MPCGEQQARRAKAPAKYLIRGEADATPAYMDVSQSGRGAHAAEERIYTEERSSGDERRYLIGSGWQRIDI